jgi:hypothetical protein
LSIGNIPTVVLTPIKNESWILHRFLSVTSTFCDAIIIVDQQSTDNSKAIASKFEKVHWFENDGDQYDEEYRQGLLIDKARMLYPGKKLLLALDADEIATANSVDSIEWKTIYSSTPGTRVYFEKPDIFFPVNKYKKYNDYFLLGFIDDGTRHIGKKIHSPRLPGNINSPRLYVEGIKFMHYAKTRILEYKARQRYYSVIENINHVHNFVSRLRMYNGKIFEQEREEPLLPIPEEWYGKWEEVEIDMRSVLMKEDNHFNLFVLHELRKHGGRKFFLDDIWDIDWNDFQNHLFPGSTKIQKPTYFYSFIRKILITIFNYRKNND